MNLISLDQVFQIVKPGIPLPFGVRDKAGQLLLSKGHVLPTQEKLIELLNRGMFVDADEAKRALAQGPVTIVAPKVSFSSRWEGLQRRLGFVLRNPADPDFLKSLDELIKQLMDFPVAEADQMLFLILRHDHGDNLVYPEAHALHTAALCHLISRRLEWPDARRRSLVGAALTMNMTMIEVQARLVVQERAMLPVQRREIDAHPIKAADLLRRVGVRDSEWLTAVEQHHEAPGGAGYPNKVADPSETSQLVRLCDIFTAKLSPRALRSGLPSHQAARDLFTQSTGNPLAAALIKECGIFPPGSYVKLATGEVAVVVRRGATAKEPVVAAVTNAQGEALHRPVERDTSIPGRQIAGAVDAKSLTRHFSAEQLYR